MKRKVGKRKKQLQQKYFFRRLLLTEGILIIASSPSAETISATLQLMAIHRSKMEKSRISGQPKPALLLTEMPPGPEAAGPDSLLWKNGPEK